MKNKGYDPQYYYENDPELKQVLYQIRDGYFPPVRLDLFKPLFNDLLYQGKPFFCTGRLSIIYRLSGRN